MPPCPEVGQSLAFSSMKQLFLLAVAVSATGAPATINRQHSDGGAQVAQHECPYSNVEVWRRTIPSKYRSRPEFAFVDGNPKLPNVLLIGDSISMRYTVDVRQKLAGIANVYRAPDNCRSTLQTLDALDTYLGKIDWDVIHFNWGIHDLTHLGLDGKATPPPAGNHQVPLKIYCTNMGKLIARLKRTGARLIWAATTPVSSKAEKAGFRRDRDVLGYNDAALDVVRSRGIVINDLYALTKPKAEELFPDGVHPNGKGGRILAKAVTSTIRVQLLEAQRVRDNHARPTITADSRGFLHIIIGGHGSGLQYRRSVRVNDASEWTPVEKFGRTTYPILICGPDDTLYITGRHDKGWEGMDFYAKPPGNDWEHRGLLVKKDKRFKYYAAYHNAMAWGPEKKTLHMSVGFFLGDSKRKGENNRDPQGLYQAVGYMRSDDAGKTWAKADGSLIRLPATTDTLSLIASGERTRDAKDQPKPGIQHIGIAVDSQNRPYVVYVRHTPNPGGIEMVTPDKQGVWAKRPLRQAISKFWPGMVAFNGRVSMTGDDVICLILTLAPLEHPKANWNPGIYGRPEFWLRNEPDIQRLVWLESRDGGRTFITRDLIHHKTDRGTMLPTLEQSVGFHSPPDGGLPALLYFEGLSRYRKPGELIQNHVFFVQP